MRTIVRTLHPTLLIVTRSQMVEMHRKVLAEFVLSRLSIGRLQLECG